MTLYNPPEWIDFQSYGAISQRRVADALLAYPGVIERDGFAVTQTGSLGMAVLVSGGSAWVAGTQVVNQGVYHVINGGPQTVAISTAPGGSDSRIDLIVLRIYDATVSGSTNVATLEAVTGTASTSPTVPNAPNNSLVLASVLVGTGVTAITNANIADLRTYRATGLGGILPCTSTTRPASPQLGQHVYEIDTNRTLAWASNSAWRIVSDVAAQATIYNPPRIFAYPQAITTVTNSTITPINLQASSYDTDGMHSNSSNISKFTCITPGIYQVTAQLELPSASGLRRLFIYKNNTAFAKSNAYYSASQPTEMQVSATIDLAVNDTLEMRAFQASGGSLDVVFTPIGATFLSATWIAPTP